MLLPVAALVLVGAQVGLAGGTHESSVSFTLSGGWSGAATLWHLGRQPLAAPGGAFDTVTVSRRALAGPAFTVGVSYFRRRHLGLSAELGVFGTRSRQGCAGPAMYAPDPNSLNAQACGGSNGRTVPTSVVGLMVGGIYRFRDAATFRPHVRVNAGLGFANASFVQTGTIVTHPACAFGGSCLYDIVSERRRPTGVVMASVAGGFSVSFDSSYGNGLRLEIRDFMLVAPAVTSAPSTPTGNYARTKQTLHHLPMVMVGFDFVLERRRARRY